MSRHDVPVVLDGATIYLPGSTVVCGDRPRPRGLSQRKPSADGRMALWRLGREAGPGPTVTLPDGRRGYVEGYAAEAARLRAELAAALATVADLEAMRATWTRAVTAEMLGDGATP